MQWEARDYSEWQGAFKQEPSILSAAIEDAMKGAVPLAFAIQQSADCPLRVRLGNAQIEQMFSALAGSGHAERRTHGVVAAT